MAGTVRPPFSETVNVVDKSLSDNPGFVSRGCRSALRGNIQLGYPMDFKKITLENGQRFYIHGTKGKASFAIRKIKCLFYPFYRYYITRY